MTDMKQAHLTDAPAGQVKLGGDSIIDMTVDGRDSQEPEQGLPIKPAELFTNKKVDKGTHFMGIPYQTPYSASRSYDYEEKYAPDPLGDEIKENARIWKVYLDEAESYDEEMLRGFKDTIDSLLVFAALFSGVVTSFIIGTVNSLQPDYGQITATLLVEQVKLLRAAGNITAINAILPSNVDLGSVISPGANNLWINGLFFTSLCLSLTTALLSVLVKQWLQAYSAMSSGNARERALIHHFRCSGLKKWKLPEIIGILPLILHASLALFFVGLSLYVTELHFSLCWIVVAITALAFTIYLGSIFIPQIWLECPYRIPLLFVPTKYILHPFSILRWMWFRLLGTIFRRIFDKNPGTNLDDSLQYPTFFKMSLEKSESEHLNSGPTTDYALSNIIIWLHTLESNQSIQRIVGQSLNGILQIHYYDSLPIYHKSLSPHLGSISQTVWNALLDLDANDAYGCEIWTSVISLWMKKTFMWDDRWPKIDLSLAKESLITSIKLNRKMALKSFIELSKSYYSTLGSIHDLYPTALHDAAMHGHLEVIEMLVENSEDVNVKGGEYGTALQAAALDSFDVVKYLVEKGADVNAQGGEYGIALQAAALGSLDIVKFLVEKGADVNIQGGEYGTALQAAATESLDIVKFLVENGADVNVQGGRYGTALQAAATGSLETVKFLVENGANVNVQGGEYGSALQAAAYRERADVVKFLVEHGEDVNIEGGKYGTALQAAATGSLDIVEYLVENNADVNAQGGIYGTALQAAAIGSLDIVKFLVEKGANINVQSGTSWPALHTAAFYGNLDIVRFLVENGADVNLPGGRFDTALQAAKDGDQADVAQYLKDHGAR